MSGQITSTLFEVHYTAEGKAYVDLAPIIEAIARLGANPVSIDATVYPQGVRLTTGSGSQSFEPPEESK